MIWKYSIITKTGYKSETKNRPLKRAILSLDYSDFFKCVFSDSANRANPVFGNVFESGSGSNAGIGISDFGIVNISAGTSVFILGLLLLSNPFLFFAYDIIII